MASSKRRGARARILPALVRATRAVPAPVLLGARPGIAAALRLVPGWRSRVRAGMTAALGPGGFERRHVSACFDRIADQIAFAAIVYRQDLASSGLLRYWHHDPAGEEVYRQALAPGKGGVMVCPHLTCHEFAAGSVTTSYPLTVLARKSPDEEYEAMKQRWYSAIGVEVVYRPGAKDRNAPLIEMTAAIRTLRRNHLLAITPDLPQRPGTGVSVQLLGKPLELPAGAFFLSKATGAPLLPSFFHWENGLYEMWTHEPLMSEHTERPAAVADLAQQWTSLFEDFLRNHPEMWQFWLDKRWVRWLSA